MVEHSVLKEQYEGKPVERAVIKEGKAEISVLSLGAVLETLIVPDRNGKPQRVVWKMDDVLSNVTSPHYGQVIGRFANRIADATFSLNGKRYDLEKNDNGNNLHGASSDYGIHQWKMLPVDKKGSSVTLEYFSKDGDGGMPGNLKVSVTYTLKKPAVLSITYKATTDADTPLNLTNHTYFNLSEGDIGKCTLRLGCSHRLEVGKTLIPTGKVLPVAGTPFDFLTPKTIGQDIDKVEPGYDHCYVIDRKGEGLETFGEVSDPDSGIVMSMATTLPAVQFYSGNFLTGEKNCNGAKKHQGMCFETQFYPDSPNHPEFPSCILKKGETAQSETVYSFSVR